MKNNEDSRITLPTLLVLLGIGILSLWAQTTTDTSGRSLLDVSDSTVAVTNEVDVTGQLGVTGTVTVADGISINVTNTVTTSGGASNSTNVQVVAGDLFTNVISGNVTVIPGVDFTNSITGTVATTQSGAWTNAIVNEPSFNIQDGSGTDITSTGGALDVNIASGSSSGTEYVTDAVAPGSPTGSVSVVIRDDALTTVTPAEADWMPLLGNSVGAQWVQLWGTNTAILAANSGVDIGDVDVTSFPDNEPFNVAQISGTAASVNLGNADAGTIRVMPASNQPPQTNVVSNAGTFATQVDGDALTALQLIDNFISGSEGQVDVIVFPDNEPFDMAQVGGTSTSTGVGNSDAGTIRVMPASNQPPQTNAISGTVAVTQSGTWTVQPGNTTNSSPWYVNANGSTVTADLGATDNAVLDNIDTQTAGAETALELLDDTFSMAQSLTVDSAVFSNVVKASAGRLHGVHVGNTNSVPLYLKLYDLASAFDPQDNIPIGTFIVPGNAAGAGNNVMIPMRGVAFSTGIGVAITGAPATNDNTAVTGVVPITVIYD